MGKTNKAEKTRFRNPIAQAAWNSKGGAMKSRNAPRGGNRNIQREFLNEMDEEE